MQLRYLFLSIITAAFLSGCSDKDKVTPDADLFYEVSINGNDVTFSNKTAGAVSYKWDFGDGTSSEEESPVHTYPGKGKYVPTLYATTKEGKVTEGSTVVYIAKSSPVKMNDNTLSDWDEVTDYQVTSGAGETYFRKAKFDYDASYVYVYLEVNSRAANADIYDFYMDTDNNPGTGLLTGTFPGGGYDVLLEGAVLADWFDAFYHKGAQDAFTFDASGVTEFVTVGATQQEGNVLKFELRLSRAKLKGLAATTALRLGIQATKGDWSATLGNMPDGSTSVLINFE
ncbi:PKD domain-containing protein [Chitinophaga pinensis]|uniref:PKD domain containing protein n=1 Tax=Chitinophaga pinensis (strain ATCC 43595 / DSM 2588 / LMG 13176 / NBRC 15968 / NCIMB 11800 / UQM 2034) TaxID=485918 RepID=A0A979G6J0_CHIPD|nr:PKD domain-containing protein [Chitinophaga pinensis]ACU61631.1 PKD domain containing protein [Chitinophaga pinensis DSM 2588]